MSGITLTEVDDALIPTPASGKSTVFLDDTLGPAYKDDGGTVHTLQGADGELTYTNHGNTGASETIDWTTNVHRIVLDASCTISFSNVPASGTPGIVEIIIVQDGTGGRTITWPAAVTWGVAGAPVLQVAANAVDVVHMQSVDGGTTVYGSIPSRSGPAGGAVSIDYLFSSTTTDADPGSGLMRLDNATTSSVTNIRADLVDRLGTTWTAVIDSLDDSTNTVKGHIRLFKSDDPSKWWLGTVSAVDSSSGYRNISVSYVAQSGASPFAAGDPVTLAFTRTGDVGAAGAGGASTRSTIGTTSAGASFATTRGLYMKKVTIPSGGRYVMSIHAFVKGNGANGVGLSSAIMSDSSGTPVSVIAVGAPLEQDSDNAFLRNLALSTTVRDIAVPMSGPVFLAAGDYWICVLLYAGADSRIQLAYNSGSGADRTLALNIAGVDHSFSGSSSGSNDYCIYIDALAL